ncbi:4918_t:CDS:2 [Dentiscutata heterogama]|uniref:4918_t:CDS:1 n=1 Tax=Dentiscutata heterogama TaxID=1316150 RepID=A0ACA9M0I7_9GLOM|nr:4918_t:CDS:2 [Dentiscutata heterogama]
MTNLPNYLYLQVGARVVFLNNKLFDDSTIGIVTKLIDNHNVEVTFPTSEAASRQQFSLQNTFTLTTHKVQCLTLPHVTTSTDESVFAEG